MLRWWLRHSRSSDGTSSVRDAPRFDSSPTGRCRFRASSTPVGTTSRCTWPSPVCLRSTSRSVWGKRRANFSVFTCSFPVLPKLGNASQLTVQNLAKHSLIQCSLTRTVNVTIFWAASLILTLRVNSTTGLYWALACQCISVSSESLFIYGHLTKEARLTLFWCHVFQSTQTFIPAFLSSSRVGLTPSCSLSSTPVRHRSSMSRSILSTTAATFAARSWTLILAMW